MEKLAKEDIVKILDAAGLRKNVEDLERILNATYPEEYLKNADKADRHKRSIEQFFLGLVANAFHTANIIENAIRNVNPGEKVANLLENLLANAVYDLGKGRLFPEGDGARINISPRNSNIGRVERVSYNGIWQRWSDDDWRGLLEGQRLVALHIKDVAQMMGMKFPETIVVPEFEDKEKFVSDMSESQIEMEKYLLHMKDMLEFLNRHSN